MKHQVFSIFDIAANSYARPFFLPANGIAIRVFTDLAVNAETDVGKHPKDYTLYNIGEFDDQTGELTNKEPKLPLLSGLEAVASSRQITPGQLEVFDEKINDQDNDNYGGTN